MGNCLSPPVTLLELVKTRRADVKAVEKHFQVHHASNPSLCNVHEKDAETHRTPLFYAQSDVFAFLIAHGADVNARDINGDTNLHRLNLGVWARRILLETKGIDIEARNNKGETPLYMYSYEKGDQEFESAKLIIAKGADINAPDNNGQTPLHAAIRTSKPLKPMANGAAAYLLIEVGANLEAKDNHGMTPLHLSCTTEDGTMISGLLNRGADIGARDNAGNLPLHHACFPKENLAQQIFVVKELIQRGAALLKRGGPDVINALNNEGFPPVHFIKDDNTEIKALLQPLFDARKTSSNWL